MIPTTVARVPEHTAEHVNEDISRRTHEDIARTAVRFGVGMPIGPQGDRSVEMGPGPFGRWPGGCSEGSRTRDR